MLLAEPNNALNARPAKRKKRNQFPPSVLELVIEMAGIYPGHFY